MIKQQGYGNKKHLILGKFSVKILLVLYELCVYEITLNKDRIKIIIAKLKIVCVFLNVQKRECLKDIIKTCWLKHI